MTLRRAARGQFVAVCAAVRVLCAQQPPVDTARHDAQRRDTVAATLIGRVTDSSGVGLPGAEITLVKSDRVHVITGDSGAFRVAGLSPGVTVFSVRRIGFAAATFTASLRPGKIQRANFPLTASPLTLPTVSISDTQPTHWLDQFNLRRAGYRGTFLTRSDIVRANARKATDIVRTIPGIHIETTAAGLTAKVVMTHGSGFKMSCVPDLFVGGLPYGGQLDDFPPEDIEAIEVYVGVSEVPTEFGGGGRRGICGAIAVWTRDPKRAP